MERAKPRPRARPGGWGHSDVPEPLLQALWEGFFPLGCPLLSPWVLPEAPGLRIPVLPVLLDPSHSVPRSPSTVTRDHTQGPCCMCGPQ